MKKPIEKDKIYELRLKDIIPTANPSNGDRAVKVKVVKASSSHESFVDVATVSENGSLGFCLSVRSDLLRALGDVPNSPVPSEEEGVSVSPPDEEPPYQRVLKENEYFLSEEGLRVLKIRHGDLHGQTFLVEEGKEGYESSQVTVRSCSHRYVKNLHLSVPRGYLSKSQTPHTP